MGNHQPTSAIIGDDATSFISDAADVDPNIKTQGKWQFNSKGMRNFAYLVLFVFVAVLLAMCTSASKNDTKAVVTPPPPVNIPSNNGAGALVNAEITTAAMAQANQEAAAKAASGKSAIAGDPPPLPPTAKPNLSMTPPPPLPDQTGGFKQDIPAPNQTKSINNIGDGLSKQILNLTKGWGYGEDLDNKTIYVKAKANSANGTATNAGPSPSVTTQPNMNSTKPKRLVGSMEVAGAALLQTINSDNPNSVVRAQIGSGALKGGIALGKAVRLDEGLQIEFKAAALNGCTFKIAAIAVDETTSQDVVSGKYDGRIAARFVFPVLLDGIRAFASAKAQTGSTVVLVNGSTGTTSPPPSTEQAKNAMIAASVTAIDAGIKQTLPTTPQVTLAMGTSIGILFVEPVFEDAQCDSSKTGAPTSQQSRN